MKYWRSMWLTPSLESGKTKLFRELKAGRPDRSVWLIALSESPGHLLDIYPGKTLRQKHYKKSEQIVIAAAGTKEEAEELSCSILYSCYMQSGDFSADSIFALVNPG
ncbi:MAG: hypothetical protein IKS18_03370 [Lachnospiraceae bacterium]|nr:hypothetical protein [Lachnospiraceae bacterium]